MDSHHDEIGLVVVCPSYDFVSDNTNNGPPPVGLLHSSYRRGLYLLQALAVFGQKFFGIVRGHGYVLFEYTQQRQLGPLS